MPPIYKPKNRAATEHRGAIDRVTFSDPAQPFLIAVLTDGATILGDADADQFAKGTIYRFLGKWTDDDKRGPRFRFSTFVVHATHSRTGVVKYLTESCEGIGQKLASRIFDKFGGASVETLRNDPAKVASECSLEIGLCEIASIQLASNQRHEDTRIDLFTLFSGRGFHGKLIDTAIKKWGVRAPVVIRRNPFALLGMPSAGFKRCDKLWSDLGLPKDSLKRQTLCAVNIVRNTRSGDTWVRGADLAAQLREAIPTADPLRAFKLGLRSRKLKKHRDASGELWLATYHRATSEERIAAALARLSSVPSNWPTERVPVSQRDGDRLPSQHQVDRLRLATAGPVGLLLGGPGTGKSHCTAYLFREVIDQVGYANVCAVAPTGKAAVRITQAFQLANLDITARTIHSTLEIGRNGHDGDGWQFGYNAGNPLPYQFLLCDETSMCDTDLLADFLDACPTGSHVLFVGDPYQLPPVGHGAPLRDMIAARVPHGELTQVRRNAGQIVHACQRIKNGESFDVCDSVDLDAEIPKNLKLIEARDENHAREQLLETIQRMTKFHPVWQTQVIVARNTKGEICRKKLNEVLQPLLNPDGYAIAGNPFKVGDKIICTRNSHMQQVEPIYTGQADNPDLAKLAENYDTVRDPEGNQPVELYVANGEIGRVVAIAAKLMVVRFSEADQLVKIPMGKQRDDDADEGGDDDAGGGKGCNCDLAYAITGHKMQGAESPCVIVMGDEQGGMITGREWLYTAISRASKLCLLIGKMSTFNRMKERLTLSRRKTFLTQSILDVRYAEL